MHAQPRFDGQVQPKNYAVPGIIATVSLGLCIILIAATIVLALIPIYIQSKASPLNPNTLTSKDVTLMTEVEQNPTTVVGRRKRAINDLASIVGCTFGPAGLTTAETLLGSDLPQDIIERVTVSSVSIVYKNDKRKKRFALSKRQTTDTILMVMIFRIVYRSVCFYSCQLKNAARVQETLYAVKPNTILFINTPLLKNGVFFGYAPRIEAVSIDYVSLILPSVGSASLGSSDQGTTPATLTSSTSTATTVTPLIG